MAKESTLSEDEACSIAFDVAMDEAFAVCSSPEGKKHAFIECAAILGIDDAAALSEHCKSILEDFEDKKKRKDKICYDFRGIRAVVMCTAWYKMESERISFKEAINAAWKEAKDKCRDVGAYI